MFQVQQTQGDSVCLLKITMFQVQQTQGDSVCLLKIMIFQVQQTQGYSVCLLKIMMTCLDASLEAGNWTCDASSLKAQCTEKEREGEEIKTAFLAFINLHVKIMSIFCSV